VVLDVVGGDYPARALDVLRPGGIVVSTQPPSVVPIAADATKRGLRVAGVIVEADEIGMSALADLAAAGKLVPAVAATFPLEEVRAASVMADLAANDQHFPLEQGGAVETGRHGPGKVVLTIM
jgi:NADPH:quinone reductase-like Zn-dependent oxidoreductase